MMDPRTSNIARASGREIRDNLISLFYLRSNELENREYDRRKFISTLMKIEHGKLEGFINDGLLASQAEPELFHHFIAWNQIKGKVRDSKVAYPIIGLRSITKSDRDLAENAISHLMLLSPRDLVRAYDFNKQMTSSGRPIAAGFRRVLETGMNMYLYTREARPNWWNRTVLQHRDSMKRLYRITHRGPSSQTLGDLPKRILFEKDYPPGSVFAKVAALKDMTAREAASVILTEKIPFEVIVGAVSNIKSQEILLAILEGMTGNQIVTNSKMLEKLGVKNDPILKAAYDSALARAKDDKRLNVLKAGVAAEKSASSPDLLLLQAEASRKQISGIEGNWLILGDCSGSMSASIELAKKIASFVTERVQGKVWLIFFNTSPTPFEVTGKTFFQIEEMTKRIIAGGGTSIGCGLEYLRARNEEVDGIVIVSDGGDNTHPLFKDAWVKYCQQFGKDPTVYFFDLAGEPDRLTSQVPDIEKFDMRHGKIDYYSLPNIISTLRTNKYSLIDEILATPLLRMEDAFKGRDN